MALTAPRGRRVALALVLAVAAGLCAFIARPGEASPTSGTSASVAELSKRLPFYDLLYARTDADTRIARAEQQDTIDCMAKHGFRYTPAPVVSTSQATGDHPQPFGLETLVQPADTTPGLVPSEKPESKAFTQALFGDPDKRISAQGKLVRATRPANGCQAHSEKQLLGNDRVRWLQLRIQLGEGEEQARQQLEKDHAFRVVNAGWRQCMSEAKFRGQKDPVSLLYGLPRNADPSKNALARADIRCKGETNYLTIAYTRLAAVQQAWLRDHAGTLAAWNALQRRQDTIARELLSSR